MNYTATQWNTAEDKEWFVKHFIKFVEKGFPQHLFTKKFYNRLMNTFGHIAHYNQQGFWDTWFTCAADKARFLKHTMTSFMAGVGDPTYTYCDAEKEIQRLIEEKGLLQKWNKIADDDQYTAEKELYHKLIRVES